MFSIKKLAGFGAGILLLSSLATPAFASGLTSSQISAIISLLQSFGADQSVIDNVSASLNGTTPPTPASCVNLSNPLFLDSTDATTNGDVSKLQQFLGGTVTGYFGPATLQLVQNWQSLHGVVTSGTPDTTGYGYVGPATRRAMGCGGNPQPLPMPQPMSGFSATPTSGTAPLGVTFSAFARGPGVVSYSINYGDGASDSMGVRTDCMGTAAYCNSTPNLNAYHLYTTPGTYTATLWRNATPSSAGIGLAAPQNVGTTTVTVIASSTNPTTTGTLSVTTDPSSPAYSIVAAGSTGVTLGVYRFTALGENINLGRVGLVLASGNANDLTGPVSLYDGANLVGTAYFTGSSGRATSTISQSLVIPANSSKILVLKGNIGQIGIASPATSGDLISVNIDTSGINTQGSGVNSGANISATGSTNVAGVRIFKSYPTVSQAALQTSVLINGVNTLMRFAVSANISGNVSLGQLWLSASPSGSGGAQAGSLMVYAYTDSSYSSPVGGFPGGLLGSVPANKLTLTTPLVIPAGATYYFKVVGTVSGATGSSAITTTLQGSSSTFGSGRLFPFSSQGDTAFVWSPNSTTTSTFSTNDWTDGYAVPGLSPSGLTQTLVGSGQLTPVPTAGSLQVYSNYQTTPTIMQPSITQADALAMCQNTAARNTWVVRCVWNGNEIFNNIGTKLNDISVYFNGMATALTSATGVDLPYALGFCQRSSGPTSATPSKRCVWGGEVIFATSTTSTIQPTATTTAVSSDGSTLLPNTSGSLVTSAGTWTFGSASQGAGSQILLNGSSAANGWGVKLLVTNGGVLYTLNSYGQWWKWQNAGWQMSDNPVPAAPTAAIPSQTPTPTSSLAQCTNAIANHGKNDQSFSCTCPANYALGAVWGSGTYTDDSDICAAAIHEGVVTRAAGGTVNYTIKPGLSSYAASVLNGVGTMSWGQWGGSYIFPTSSAGSTAGNGDAGAGSGDGGGENSSQGGGN